MAGTNKPFLLVLRSSVRGFFCPQKESCTVQKKKACTVRNVGNTFQLPDVPKKGSVHTCPACGYRAKVSCVQYQLNDIHWSCIATAAGKRSVIQLISAMIMWNTENVNDLL